jgi:hypothetical protein
MDPLVVWRVAVAGAFCAVPALVFLRMEAQVTHEALVGGALEIAPPNTELVLGVGLGMLLAVPPAGVAYLLLVDPREGAAGVLAHDALMVGLFAGAVALRANTLEVFPSAVRWGPHAVAAAGLFAAEALWVSARIRKPWVGVALALVYTVTAASALRP